MAPKGSPESLQSTDSEFNPNMSLMRQALRIVAPSLIVQGSQEIAEQRMAERYIDELDAEELRR